MSQHTASDDILTNEIATATCATVCGDVSTNQRASDGLTARLAWACCAQRWLCPYNVERAEFETVQFSSRKWNIACKLQWHICGLTIVKHYSKLPLFVQRTALPLTFFSSISCEILAFYEMCRMISVYSIQGTSYLSLIIMEIWFKGAQSNLKFYY